MSRVPIGRSLLDGPGFKHDDTVMALAMAWTTVSVQHRLIYPIPDTKLVIQEFTIPDAWPRAYALDIRWNAVAVIWGARNPQSDVLYLFSEYSAEADPAIHVAAIRSLGAWILGLIDPLANGRNQADGNRLLQTYRNLGLRLQAIENPLESGTLNVWQRMDSGRLRVFPTLVRYLEQRRSYRRDEKGRVLPDQDSLQDATRCLVNGISRMCTQLQPAQPRSTIYRGSMGWAR